MPRGLEHRANGIPTGDNLAARSSYLRSSVLVVEPHFGKLLALRRAFEPYAATEGCGHFAGARERLLANPPDRLVTNLRLHAYNGLHLVHLLKAPTRAIVYMDPPDPALLSEAQRAGAFTETPIRLLTSAHAYVAAALPLHDRRQAGIYDRRAAPRGGRRAADLVAAT